MKAHVISTFIITFLACMVPFLTWAQSGDCPNMNQPAPISDSCHVSPFFCGQSLIKYCGSNQGLTDDTFLGNTYSQAGFFRISVCSDSVELKVSVFDCTPADGALHFAIYPDYCFAGNLLNETVVQDSTDGLLAFTNASSSSFYTVMVSGVNNSVCSFSVEAQAGIGTALPGPDSCVCTTESVTGPDFICPGELYEYSVSLPSCTVFPTDPIGGNGLFCVPDGSCPPKPDSLVWKWHIPPGTSFVGDSTGLTISIQLDPAYAALDTVRNDSIWLEWYYVYSDSSLLDSLNFCVCYGAGCSGSIKPKYVVIKHEFMYFSCQLNCDVSSCDIEGQVFTEPGTYDISTDNCVTKIVDILENFEQPSFIPLLNQTICFGDQAILTVMGGQSDYLYAWNTGETGPTITVSPQVTTMYDVTVTDTSNGCKKIDRVTVEVIPPILPTFLPDVTLCPGGVYDVCGQLILDPGDHVITCQSYQGCDSVVHVTIIIPQMDFTPELMNGPVCTGQIAHLQVISSNPNLFYTWSDLSTGNQYTGTNVSVPVVTSTSFQVSALDPGSGCIETISFLLPVTPLQQLQLGQVASVSCDNPCVIFQGKQYCAPGNYVDTFNCAINSFSIGFFKDTINQGTVGTLDCDTDCITFNNQTYCTSGSYSYSDTCHIYTFDVGSDFTEPTVSDLNIQCLPSNTHYTVSFKINGQAPFVVNNQPIVGNFYFSNPVANNTPYLFVIKHANGCKTEISGIFDCAANCITDAGILPNEVLIVCLDQTHQCHAEPDQTPTLAPDDVVTYQIRNEAGEILLQNDSGVFEYNSGIFEPGTFYEMVVVAGPPDVNGLPDLNHACTDISTPQMVVFYDSIGLHIDGDSTFFYGQEVELKAVASQATGTVNWWHPERGLLSENNPLVFMPDSSQLIYCAIVDQYGCVDTAALFLEEKLDYLFQIPNAFTPNNDQYNDVFLPFFHKNIFKGYQLQVYATWGQRVFASHHVGEGWDGTINGKPAASAVYLYTFEYTLLNGNAGKLKGEVNLIR